MFLKYSPASAKPRNTHSLYVPAVFAILEFALLVIVVSCFTWIIAPGHEYFDAVRKTGFILVVSGAVPALILGVILLRIMLQKQKADAKTSEAEGIQKDIAVVEKILNSLDALIYSTNPRTGEIIFANEKIKKHFVIQGDCTGKLCYKVFRIGMNERCDFCPCRELDDEPGKKIEWVEHNIATQHTYRNTDCYIEWPGGETVHLHHSVDITEVDRAREQAIEANRAKSGFLARISHEIRTPLNVILGITEIQLDKQNLAEDIKESFNRVHNSGYLLLGIINDILDLTKIESGKFALTPVTYNFHGLINDTVQMNLMRFDSKPIEFRMTIDENIPSTLYGDDLRIKQILNNILSNAFKYTDKGKVSLSISANVRKEGFPVTLVFRISDTGQGMTDDQVKTLFDDYSRFNTEANRTVEGTGLGMSITKHLVGLMSGEIFVESEPGKGSVFTVHLPQDYVEGSVLGKEGTKHLQQLQSAKTLQTNTLVQIKREYMPYGKVLIVDDLEPNLYVSRGLLAPYGLSMETATSGFEAVDKIKRGADFDIIFMDHFMPDMDGMEAAKIIRELGYKKSIIALTANALAGQEEFFLENGFDGFISKPIDIRQLNTVLNKLVRDKYPAETVEAARRLKDKLEQKTTAKNDLSHLKALVVDDFEPNLDVAASMLRKYKIQTDCVSSGQEAFSLIESGNPAYNFIFMDHFMPDMDGMETTRLIRSLGTEYSQNIHIIAVTANDSAENEHMFLDNGFQAIISKPLSMAKLDTFIKNWIRDTVNKNAAGAKKAEKPMKIEIPGIDEKKIMELYDGDMEVFMRVLRSYVSSIPKSLDVLRSVSKETLPKYVISVHGIKSTSESIGAEQARKLAAELEILAKAGSLSSVLEKNGALLDCVENLLETAKQYLAQLDA